MAQRGRVGRTAARGRKKFGEGEGPGECRSPPPAACGFWGLGRGSRRSAGRGGAATRGSSWGMWRAYPSDPRPSGAPGGGAAGSAGGRDRRPLRPGARTGSGGADAEGAEGDERRCAALDVPGARLHAPLVGGAQGMPGPRTPSPCRALGDLCSCGRPRARPRAPLGPPWSRGKPPTSAASLGAPPGARAAAAAGPERRPASPGAAGRRATPPVSASEPPGRGGGLTWTRRRREAEASGGSRSWGRGSG